VERERERERTVNNRQRRGLKRGRRRRRRGRGGSQGQNKLFHVFCVFFVITGILSVKVSRLCPKLEFLHCEEGVDVVGSHPLQKQLYEVELLVDQKVSARGDGGIRQNSFTRN
jgi:hypothetical protein